MKRIIVIVLMLNILLAGGCSRGSNDGPTTTFENTGADRMEQVNLSQYFSGYEGTFMLFDKNSGKYIVYNEAKSKKRMPPCSTFKIVNSLIGLETGVVKGENSLYKWDGKKRSIEDWNRDHTLASAVKYSVVWYFQELARNVGSEKMQSFINEVDYGNKDISGGIDRFWLQSSLEISPAEQIEMLKKFYDYKLPFSKRNIDIVKNIIVNSKEGGTTFSGKTGSGEKDGKAINGWFVGYVEKGGNVYFFATNIEGKENATGTKAKEITIDILKDRGLLPK